MEILNVKKQQHECQHSFGLNDSIAPRIGKLDRCSAAAIPLTTVLFESSNIVRVFNVECFIRWLFFALPII